MSRSVKLHPVFTEKHRDYMRRAVNSTISVAEGSVRAGKTVDNVAVFAKMIDLGAKDRIHLATGSTSANAKLNIGDCNGMGLEHIFRGRCRWTKYRGNEALAIKSHGRTYIVIFAGGGKADSYKKIHGNSYGMWIATEINLHHPHTIKEAFDRLLAAQTRRILWDLNPNAPGHWIYKEYIDRFSDSFGPEYNYGHFTIRDNAAIPQKRLEEIEAQYDKGSVWYKRSILGIRCAAEGVVYDIFGDGHITDHIFDTQGDFIVSSDFGMQNATTFLFWRRIGNTCRWMQVGEYYYSGRESHRQKTVSELVEDMLGYQRNLSCELGRPEGIPVKRVIVDPSAAPLKTELRKNHLKVRDADNEVLTGISDVRSALAAGIISIYRGCKHTIEEFGLYMWDTSASEKGEDAVVKENDHCMDAVRYFVRTERIYIRQKTGEGGQYRSYLAD